MSKCVWRIGGIILIGGTEVLGMKRVPVLPCITWK